MRRFALAAILVVGTTAAAGQEVVRLNAQHAGYRSIQIGSGAESYWLFEPAAPQPREAPVVVFLHGWLAANPGLYGAWIEHLVRRGAIVIYPRYHVDALTSPADYLPNALAAVRDALAVLGTAPDRVRPDLERFALLGHSAGGNLAVQMAAVAQANGLPEPRAAVAVLPGEVRPVPGPDLGQIPATCLLAVAVAEQDLVVGDARARALFQQATSIPPDRKLFVLYRSELSTSGWLVADHFSPYARRARLDSGEGPLRLFQNDRARVDRLDVEGYWRLADLTFSAAFSGRSLDEATSHGQRLRDMGEWPDGQPVRRPIVSHSLAAVPRLFPHSRCPPHFLVLATRPAHGLPGAQATARRGGPAGSRAVIQCRPRESVDGSLPGRSPARPG